ncbi:mitochondrial inner membrane protease ATP23 homolog [Frieseomelitta varia]|uniref:mitochondrial inner membrane protease ATP23 homolog n=1 Tax=Frieseomelitta varia TaxID=561572 RepID=UPI001CB6B2FF|nr:mitochondrial inner membrane protease ATP23 homolog [Frieseomelitta varia]XP_043515001.1 mitochondrial inner membrane protease ATP23 homolog [Frieseomelitta varia]
MTVKNTENEGNFNTEEAEYSDLYPSRKKSQSKISTWFDKITFNKQRENYQKLQCEINVFQCVKDSPLMKLLLGALKSSGCEVELGRHISCEVCDEVVTGGYDPETNQIIICQNTANSKNRVHSTLSHEMIHMFDYCRNKLDLQNLNHLACTEIRAANQCHCSFLGAWIQGTASLFNIKKAHQNCVIDKAVRSVIAITNISKEEATEAVMQVFDKCYNDLEPIGRRLRRNSLDMEKAYYDGMYYGYID